MLPSITARSGNHYPGLKWQGFAMGKVLKQDVVPPGPGGLREVLCTHSREVSDKSRGGLEPLVPSPLGSPGSAHSCCDACGFPGVDRAP